MLIRFGFGHLHAGRPFASRHDAALTLCLGPRGDVPPGEIGWCVIFRLAWAWIPDRNYRTAVARPGELTSAAWTGRARTFVGFGEWRRIVEVFRVTRRSRMYVYLTGAKERANPKHIMYVAPGRVVANAPKAWLEDDGAPKTFEVEFVHGRANVDEQLGRWLIETRQAAISNIVKPRGSSLLGSLAKMIAGEPRTQF